MKAIFRKEWLVVQQLENEIKELIIEALDLEDTKPEDIDANAPLFGEGLGLDSIDALEIGVELQKKYNLKLGGHPNIMKEHFQSVSAMAKFVSSYQSKN